MLDRHNLIIHCFMHISAIFQGVSTNGRHFT